jgi:hypothetical protein
MVVVGQLAQDWHACGVRGDRLFPCACCGYQTMAQPATGTYDICPVCFWEDDLVQYEDPTYAGGANRPNLIESRVNFERYGACEPTSVRHVRPPTPADFPRALTLYRPVGQSELDLIAAESCRAFPPRLPAQPIFYPVLNRRYAEQIASRWNSVDSASGFVGYLTRFEVEWDAATSYEPHNVGGRWHWELWVPAERLNAFNEAIVGEIEVIGEHRSPA